MRPHSRREQNLDRLATAEAPVLPDLLDAQFQTLLRLEGSTKRNAKEN